MAEEKDKSLSTRDTPYDFQGPTAFLAHARADKDLVREFRDLLSLDGFRPWFDAVDLVVGQDWEREISIAVRDSHTVVVFLSGNSVDHRGYVQKEITLALDAAAREPEGAIYILPVRLDNSKVPSRLERLHWLESDEPPGMIGEKYRALQLALMVRAEQLEFLGLDQVATSGPLITYKTVRGPAAIFGRGEAYLVRGRNPTGQAYVGVARLRVDERNAELKTEIGRQTLVYRGTYDGETLVVDGPHHVEYDARARSGVLRGRWEDGGLEELIPASAFAKRPAMMQTVELTAEPAERGCPVRRLAVCSADMSQAGGSLTAV